MSLRERLSAVVEAEAVTEPRTAPKVAFALYGSGQPVGREWARTSMSASAVARAVLDRCDRALREERGASLLDVMFGREGNQETLDDSGLDAAGDLCLGVRLDGAVGEPGREAGRHRGSQHGRDRRGAGGGRVHFGGGAAVCRGPRRADRRGPRGRRDGRGLRLARASGGGGRGAERVAAGSGVERRRRQRRPAGGERATRRTSKQS